MHTPPITIAASPPKKTLSKQRTGSPRSVAEAVQRCKHCCARIEKGLALSKQEVKRVKEAFAKIAKTDEG